MIIEIFSRGGISCKARVKCDFCNKESIRSNVYVGCKRNFCNIKCYSNFLVTKRNNKLKSLMIQAINSDESVKELKTVVLNETNY